MSNVKNVRHVENALSIDYLVKDVMETFHSMLRANVYENSYTKEEIENRIEQKKELRKALHNCAYGDRKAKTYVKDYIKDILIKKYKINRENINKILSFSNIDKLSEEDKFDIMLYLLEKEHKNVALHYLIQKYHLDEPKLNDEKLVYYEITKEDIHLIFEQFPYYELTFNDELNILTQRIYQLYKGNGVIDVLRDMKIDGVSAGVSGIPESFDLDCYEELKEMPASFDSVWIFYRGKSIHLSFLSFSSYKELIRVCKNIYRYNNPPGLTEVTGFIVNEMKDGSRVSVARPPFCESWVLFVRKFDSVLQEDIGNLITDKHSNIPIELMKWLIKGCQVIGITGEQGSGKTTLLMALIRYINPTYNLRIQELSFELHLRKIYPKRNIVTFREINSITGEEGLNFQKKTDGTVNILGEVASAPVANWLVQMSLVASLFTMFTHHAKTTEDLVISLRNSLLLEGGFHNEKVATEQVVSAIRFDIHMKKSVSGHRYIDRISEIVPKKQSFNRNHVKEEKMIGNDLTNDMFEIKDIVVWKRGKYYFKEKISHEVLKQMTEHLSEEELKRFKSDLKKWRNSSNA